jgi:hypothetical protein
VTGAPPALNVADRCADKDNAKARALKPAQPMVLLPVRRWTQLFVSIGKLNAEYNDSQIHNNLEELARAIHTLLYRIRLLFTSSISGAVFHILNIRHIVTIAHAAYEAPLRTQLSSEVLPSNSGGLGADAMVICQMFESNLELVKSQYIEECLSSHIKEMMSYVSMAHGLIQADKTPAELRKALGEPSKARVCIRLLPWESACSRTGVHVTVQVPTCTIRCLS